MAIMLLKFSDLYSLTLRYLLYYISECHVLFIWCFNKRKTGWILRWRLHFLTYFTSLFLADLFIFCFYCFKRFVCHSPFNWKTPDFDFKRNFPPTFTFFAFVLKYFFSFFLFSKFSFLFSSFSCILLLDRFEKCRLDQNFKGCILHGRKFKVQKSSWQ